MPRPCLGVFCVSLQWQGLQASKDKVVHTICIREFVAKHDNTSNLHIGDKCHSESVEEGLFFPLCSLSNWPVYPLIMRLLTLFSSGLDTYNPTPIPNWMWRERPRTDQAWYIVQTDYERCRSRRSGWVGCWQVGGRDRETSASILTNQDQVRKTLLKQSRGERYFQQVTRRCGCSLSRNAG